MATAVTLAARRAKADIQQGGTSQLRGHFLLTRKKDTTTYRICAATAVYSAGNGADPQLVWSGQFQAPATETYDRVLLCGSVGAYSVADLTTMQSIVNGDVSAPVVDPTSANTCCIAWTDVADTEFTLGQWVNPQITVAESSV